MTEIYENALQQVEQHRITVQKFAATTPEHEQLVADVQQLLTVLSESLTVLQENSAQIENDEEPDISYKIYASGVVVSADLLPQVANYLKGRFPAYNFKAQKLLPLIEQFKKLKNLARVQSQGTVQTTFLDALLNRAKFVADRRVQPNLKGFAARLKQMVASGVQPEYCFSSVYARAVCVGKAFEPKYGKWVPSEGVTSDAPVSVAKDAEIEAQIVVGGLFVTVAKGAIEQNRSEGLRIARLISSIQPDGELTQLVTISRNLFTVSLRAVVEYLNNLIYQMNEKSVDKIVFRVSADERQQTDIILTTLTRNPVLFENVKVIELLEALQQKTQQYFDDEQRLRQVFNLVNTHFLNNSGQQFGINITQTAATTQQKNQLKTQLLAFCYQKCVIEQIIQFNQKFRILSNEEKEHQRQQIIVDLEATAQETESFYQQQLLVNTELPITFQINDIDTGTQNAKVKVQILAGTKILKQAEFPLKQATAIRTIGQQIQLGCDLSTDLKEPLTSFNIFKKNLPVLKICVLVGSHSQQFNLPQSLGEQTAAYDVSTNFLEFTCGYYVKITGAAIELQPVKTAYLQEYDPNMQVQEVFFKKPEQQVVERKTSRVSGYRGGDFSRYKMALRDYYELDQQGDDANKYDKRNFVNLIDKANATSMDVLEERQYYKQQPVPKAAWHAFENLWLGVDGEPLFFPQFLAAMKQLYEQQYKNQSVEKQTLEILWPQEKWVNPFIIQPFFFRGRELYPARMLLRDKGRKLYKAWQKETKYDEQEQQEWKYDGQPQVSTKDGVKGLSKEPFIDVQMFVSSISPIEEKRSGFQYFVTAILVGCGDPISTDPVEAVNKICKYDALMSFKAPLPEIIDQNGVVVGYGDSDETLAQMPYALKLILYEVQTEHSTHLALGQITLPLRSLFLNCESKQDIQLQNIQSGNESAVVSYKLSCSFVPPRIPQSASPDLYFCNIDYNSYSRELPRNIAQSITKIKSIPTRFSPSNTVEKQVIQDLSEMQRQQYLSKYAARIQYYKRGISLFALTLQNELLFFNDFLIQIATAQQLCIFLKINNVDEAIQFAVSIPFIPDQLSRYYTESGVNQSIQETRLCFEQVLQLCGGDYFEHACILQACLCACGVQAYVARVCTQTVVNEYYVFVQQQEGGVEQNILIDPISGTSHIVSKTNMQLEQSQSYVTKLIMLFNQNELLVNMQADMTPCYCRFNFADSRQWESIKHSTAAGDVDFNKFFVTDQKMASADLGRLEDDWKRRISDLVKSTIKEWRQDLGQYNTVSLFNETVEEALYQGRGQAVDRYDYQKYVIDCPYEDMTTLLERIQQSAIYMSNDSSLSFALIVKVKSFGLKFGFVGIELYRLKNKTSQEASTRIIKQRGIKFGIGL